MEYKLKDPDAVENYSISWSSWLAGTGILVASDWSVSDDSIHILSSSFTDTISAVQVSGGIVSNIYLVTNHVTSSDGQSEDESIRITMYNK